MLFGKKGQGEALPATSSGFSDARSLLCAVCAWPHSGGCSPGMPWEEGLPQRGVGLQWEWDLQGMVQVVVSMSVHTQNVWVSRAELVRPWKLPAFHWPQERAHGRLPGALQCPFPGTGHCPCHHPAGFGRSPLPTFQTKGRYLCSVLGFSLLSPGRRVPPGAAVGPGVDLSLFLFLFSLERKSSHLSHVSEFPNLPSQVGMHK